MIRWLVGLTVGEEIRFYADPEGRAVRVATGIELRTEEMWAAAQDRTGRYVNDIFLSVQMINIGLAVGTDLQLREDHETEDVTYYDDDGRGHTEVPDDIELRKGLYNRYRVVQVVGE